jgi:protein-L-isoaspartate(D-aspartate) O-methyltransferase
MFGLFGSGSAPQSISHQAQLVHHLVQQGLLRTPRVVDAFRHVDRGSYVNPDLLSSPEEAYADRPLPIGSGQTISAPHMHAMCTEALEPALRKPGARVLDVGSGSGFLVSVFARLVGAGGYVLGVEKEPDLAARSVFAITRANPEVMMSTGRSGHAGDGEPPGSPRTPHQAAAPMGAAAAAAVSSSSPGPAAAAAATHNAAAAAPAPLSTGVRIVHGNVLDPDGPLKGEPPFDAIHVGAAADALHAPLLAALAKGGRMIVPVGARYGAQELTLVEKDKETGEVTRRRVTAVQYVPLTKPGEADDGVSEQERRRYARLMHQGQGEEDRRHQHHHQRHPHHQHHHEPRPFHDDEEM